MSELESLLRCPVCKDTTKHLTSEYEVVTCVKCCKTYRDIETYRHEELDRLRRIEAAARAWLEAEDRFQAEIYDTQGRLPVWPEVIAAREALRQTLGGGW